MVNNFDIKQFLDLNNYEQSRNSRRKGANGTQEFFTPYSIVKRMCDKMTNEEVMKKNGGKKFDICLMNPPFSGSLHLDFLEKCIELCNKTVIIEPGQWLVQLKENGKYTKEDSQAKRIKDIIEGHIKSIELNNYNKALNVNNKTTCSITAIDLTKNYFDINFECCNEEIKVNSLKDCNLVGDFDIIKSILSKCKKYNEHMVDHCIKLSKYKNYENKGYWFIPYANYMLNNLGSNCSDDIIKDNPSKRILGICKFGEYLNSYLHVCCSPNKDDITYDKVRLSQRKGNPVDSVYGTKEEIENWHYFTYNNKLPLFINICLTIDENNNSKEYIPWLVDKKYTDEEIYNLLNINKEEQNFIDNIIKKYERHSEWFKLLTLGHE